MVASAGHGLSEDELDAMAQKYLRDHCRYFGLQLAIPEQSIFQEPRLSDRQWRAIWTDVLARAEKLVTRA